MLEARKLAARKREPQRPPGRAVQLSGAVGRNCRRRVESDENLFETTSDLFRAPVSEMQM